jgi:hypothetical protein
MIRYAKAASVRIKGQRYYSRNRDSAPTLRVLCHIYDSSYRDTLVPGKREAESKNARLFILKAPG